ncbi:MAG: hypothetical protein V7K32_23765 [Nostoc sp.]
MLAYFGIKIMIVCKPLCRDILTDERYILQSKQGDQRCPPQILHPN